jgi:4-hydroxy-2-oxoheptanedioate aldolase
MREHYTSAKSAGAVVITRVQGADDRAGIQQALDLGSEGIMVPYVNTAEDVRKSISCCMYPEPSKHDGSRSVYFPMTSTNAEGLLGYVGNANGRIFTMV